MAIKDTLKKFVPLNWRQILAKRRGGLPAMRHQWLVNAMRQRLQTSPHPLTLLGTEYGGWWIPLELIDASWVCYCGGVGEDASFDLALMKEKGCTVYGIDPTPRAIAYAERVRKDNPDYGFLPYGLWSEATTLKFYSPANKEHVSHSMVRGFRGQERDYISVPCRSIPSIMQELGHTRLDLLKIDIEGSEYAVLDSLLKAKVFPRVLCVEFDQPTHIYNTSGITMLIKPLSMIARLQAAGYVLAHINEFNTTFIHQP